LVEIEENDDRGEVRISIQDDGNGFDPSAESDGFGLSGMRERVELAKGSIEIHSSAGEGTKVVAVIPSRRGANTARSA
jgi:signal transduction histidine kinase